MRFLITFILVLSGHASIAQPKAKKIERKIAQVESTAPTAQVFLRFIACRNEMLKAKDNSWMSCMEESTVGSPTRRQSFAQFLFLPYDYKKVRDCQKVEVEMMKTFPEYQKDAICFEFEEGGVMKTGAAFFIRIGGKPKLFSLFRLP